MMALSLAASLARQGGYIDDDIRVVGINGLVIAWYGNLMPKRLVPNAHARQVTRVGGWAMVLSGLVYTGLWIFAPITMAVIGGCSAILFGIAVTVAYSLLLRTKAKVA